MTQPLPDLPVPTPKRDAADRKTQHADKHAMAVRPLHSALNLQRGELCKGKPGGLGGEASNDSPGRRLVQSNRETVKLLF